jgi:hypothetical protein
MDCGTMSYADIARKRFHKYRSSPHLVLWVCPTAARMEGLRKHAAIIRHVALFTTLDDALANPHASIWIDADGEQGALPRSTSREGGQINLRD